MNQLNNFFPRGSSHGGAFQANVPKFFMCAHPNKNCDLKPLEMWDPHCNANLSLSVSQPVFKLLWTFNYVLYVNCMIKITILNTNFVIALFTVDWNITLQFGRILWLLLFA